MPPLFRKISCWSVISGTQIFRCSIFRGCVKNTQDTVRNNDAWLDRQGRKVQDRERVNAHDRRGKYAEIQVTTSKEKKTI